MNTFRPSIFRSVWMGGFESACHITSSGARLDMLRATHTADAPWTVINANDQRRARLEAMRVILGPLTYKGKNADAIGAVDPKITASAPDYLAHSAKA